jgi:hypothetical protein
MENEYTIENGLIRITKNTSSSTTITKEEAERLVSEKISLKTNLLAKIQEIDTEVDSLQEQIDALEETENEPTN